MVDFSIQILAYFFRLIASIYRVGSGSWTLGGLLICSFSRSTFSLLILSCWSSLSLSLSSSLSFFSKSRLMIWASRCLCLSCFSSSCWWFFCCAMASWMELLTGTDDLLRCGLEGCLVVGCFWVRMWVLDSCTLLMSCCLRVLRDSFLMASYICFLRVLAFSSSLSLLNRSNLSSSRSFSLLLPGCTVWGSSFLSNAVSRSLICCGPDSMADSFYMRRRMVFLGLRGE